MKTDNVLNTYPMSNCATKICNYCGMPNWFRTANLLTRWKKVPRIPLSSLKVKPDCDAVNDRNCPYIDDLLLNTTKDVRYRCGACNGDLSMMSVK